MEEYNLQLINTIIAVLGFAAVIISLARVQKSYKASSVGKLYDELHQIHNTFITYPEYRPIFYNNAGVDILKTEKERLRARAIAELFFDVFEHTYELASELNKKQRAMWRRYVKDMCQSSHYIVDYLEENLVLFYPGQFKDDVKEAIEELKKKRSKNRDNN